MIESRKMNSLGNLSGFAGTGDTVTNAGQVAVQRAQLEQQSLVYRSGVFVETTQLAAHFVSFFSQSFANDENVTKVRSEVGVICSHRVQLVRRFERFGREAQGRVVEAQ